MRMQTILSLIVLAALAAGGIGGNPFGSASAADAPPASPPAAETRPSPAAGAPDTAPAVAEARQTFLADHGLKGKCVLVVFGRPGAAEKDPPLERMTFLAREKIIPSLAYLRVEQGLDAAAVKARHAARPLPFEAVADPRGEIAKAFDAAGGPAVLLVDKFGRTRYRGQWPDEARLEDWVKMLAGEKADVGPDEPLLAGEPLDVPKLLAATRLPDLKEQPATLKSHVGKAGLMVMFVDTTCPFSNEAVGGVASVAKVLAAHEVNTVLVNLDDDAREAVLEYHKAHDAGVPVRYDTTARTKHLWGVESVPTVAIIAGDGTLGYRGKAVWADVTAAAEKSLKLAAGSLQVKEQGTGYG